MCIRTGKRLFARTSALADSAPNNAAIDGCSESHRVVPQCVLGRVQNTSLASNVKWGAGSSRLRIYIQLALAHLMVHSNRGKNGLQVQIDGQFGRDTGRGNWPGFSELHEAPIIEVAPTRDARRSAEVFLAGKYRWRADGVRTNVTRCAKTGEATEGQMHGI